MKRLLITLAYLGCGSLFAQTVDEISAFQNRGLYGSARYVGMGGAFTALGNDMSALHINPASAAVYRFDNLGMTLGFQSTSSSQSYMGSSNSESQFNLLFQNVGFVKKFESGDSDWSQLAFSASYNRLADFNHDFRVNSTNTGVTLGEYWLAGANGIAFDNLVGAGLIEEAAATEAGVLVTDTLDNIVDFGYYLPNSNGLRYTRLQSGSLSEVAINLGGQYKDEFYYGIGLGFPNLTYTVEDQIAETGLVDSTFPFDISQYALNRFVDMYANGFNIKLGAIYRPAQWWRVGISYESPSWFTITQNYEVDVQATGGGGTEALQSQVYASGDYSYRLQTPSIYRFGTAFIFGKAGLISIDYEFRDPSSSRLYLGRESFNILSEDLNTTNDALAAVMRGSSTLKSGAEYRIGPVSLRAGYQYIQSWFSEGDLYTNDSHIYTAGIGIRGKYFGVDISYSRSSFEQTFFTHGFNNELVQSDITRGNVSVGANFRF